MLFSFLLGVTVNTYAQTPSTQNCDLLYSHRGADLMAAVDCYGSVVAASSVDAQKTLFERSFIALSAIVNDSPKTQDEIDAISKALKLVDDFSKNFSNTAEFFYWRAVFVSFDAIQRDRGSVLPRHLFGVIKSLQQDLRQAISMDPSIHVWGPNRVLGIMHTQMPGIVGGDKVLAEKLLSEAYQKAPQICSNHTAYAKILMVNGKDAEAKSVLTKFLSLSDSDLNPYLGEPLRNLKPENDRDRKVAQDMLDQLNNN